MNQLLNENELGTGGAGGLGSRYINHILKFIIKYHNMNKNFAIS